MRYQLSCLVVTLAAFVVCSASVSAADQDGTVHIERVPDSGIQPQAVMAGDGVLHLLYFKGDPAGGDLLYVRRKPGEAFSRPLRINSQQGSAIAIGTIRGGQLALGRKSRVHVVWNGSSQAEPKGPGRGSPMLYTRLNEKGDAFEPQRNLMQRSEFLDGGGTVAADQAGNVYVSWHGKPIDGEAGPEHRRVWVAFSRDGGTTFAPEQPAFERETGACPCCGMRAFTNRQGNPFLIYRAATAAVQRDMWLLASGDQGKSFKGLLLDKWEIDSCPMSSQAFAEGPGGLYTAWDTRGQIYFARIAPDKLAVSRTIPAEGTGTQRKHPALAVNARGEVLLAWTEGTGWQRGGNLAWQVYNPDGSAKGQGGRIRGGIRVWGSPAAVANADGTFTVFH